MTAGQILETYILNKHTIWTLFSSSRTTAGKTPLELSIDKNLPRVVECLCRKGVDMSLSSSQDPPLWKALSENEDIASILVRHGVDTDGWGPGPDGCRQTLLHRAIDENNEQIGCFLIRSGSCDLNASRKLGPDGQGGEVANDMASPIHLCCQWGLEEVVQALMEHGAEVNAKVRCEHDIYFLRAKKC